jgi:hypothetical protein
VIAVLSLDNFFVAEVFHWVLLRTPKFHLLNQCLATCNACCEFLSGEEFFLYCFIIIWDVV